ncbi:MAG: MFS transporter, partial [Alphaproteobacteria bacterium]
VIADTIDEDSSMAPPEARRALASIGGRLFGPTISHLAENLDAADARYRQARRDLAGNGREMVSDAATRAARDSRLSGAAAVPDPSRSLARLVASRLAFISAFVIVASALVLGIFILRNVNESIAPELAGRTNLIGTVVGENVQRAVGAGVPLDRLVGAESYFGDMLAQLPEVAYVAVATGRIVLEAGERIDPYLAPPRQRKDVRSHPIMYAGEEIAYVVIDIDPAFISRRFLDVFLDVMVVVLVTVFVAFEVMVLMTSRTLTAALDHLQRLTAMQAAGDFSTGVVAATRGAVGRLTVVLVRRAERLHEIYLRALQKAGPVGPNALRRTGERLGLTDRGLQTARFNYFTDVRLALFLFAAADQLPLSFLPLYTRAATNSFTWLNESVVISLPLAGYLLAILLATPYSRSLAQRFGRRRLMLIAAAPTVVAHIGLYFAASVTEIVLWRSLTGVGYALVTLACQDYVIDTSPRAERDRSLGMFSLVLFAGIFCGAALGGVLADRLGQANVFLLSAALIALSSLLVAWLVGRSDTSVAVDNVTVAGMVRALRDMKFSALVFGIAIPANVINQAFISYLVALTLDSLGASTADIGRTLMLYFLGVGTVGALAPGIQRFGLRAPVLATGGQLVAGGALLLAAVAPSQMTIIAATTLAGIGHGLVRGTQMSIALGEAERSSAHLSTSVVLAALRALERAGSIVGLIGVAAIAGVFGFQPAIAATAVLSLLGAAAFLPFVVESLSARTRKAAG